MEHAYTEAAGAYAHPTLPGGSLCSTLTSLHPYAHFEFNARTRLWGVLGYGRGDLALAPDGAAEGIQSGLENALVAFGGRTTLNVAVRGARRFELALRSDARFTDTASDAAANLRGDSGATSRVRAVRLQGSLRW